MENIVSRIRISGTDVKVTEKKLVTSGMVGAAVCIEFDEIWAGLSKTAVFETGAVVKDVLITGEQVTVPHECLSKAGCTLRVGIYGTDMENNVVIPTVYGEIGWVNRGADPSGDESTDPKLPIWAQLQAEVEALKQNSPSGGLSVTYDKTTGELTITGSSVTYNEYKGEQVI